MSLFNVTSPLFRDTTVDSCLIEVSLYQAGLHRGSFKVVGEAHNHTWVIAEINGDDHKRSVTGCTRYTNINDNELQTFKIPRRKC